VSAFGDAMRAVRQFVLMQANMERLQGDFDRLADDLRGLKDFASGLDKRLVRIETMIEMSVGRGGQPRIEG
jgi:archaellum component FlaC